jgi:hypothetical protein
MGPGAVGQLETGPNSTAPATLGKLMIDHGDQVCAKGLSWPWRFKRDALEFEPSTAVFHACCTGSVLVAEGFEDGLLFRADAGLLGFDLDLAVEHPRAHFGDAVGEDLRVVLE